MLDQRESSVLVDTHEDVDLDLCAITMALAAKTIDLEEWLRRARQWARKVLSMDVEPIKHETKGP